MRPITYFPLLSCLGALLLLSGCGDSPQGQDALGNSHLALSPNPLPEGFDWSVPERLRDADGDGVVDLSPGTIALANPTEFPVHLDACAATPVSDFEFTWEVDQSPLSEKSCLVRHVFSQQGTFLVRLTLRRKATGEVYSYLQDVVVKDWFIVSLGDSYASGEGAPERGGFWTLPTFDPKDPSNFLPSAWVAPLWASPRCHRSGLSAAALAAHELERADRRSSVTFISMACSGATLDTETFKTDLWYGTVSQGKGVLGPYIGIEPPSLPWQSHDYLPPQVAALATIASGRPVDALLISGGGNDFHFADVLEDCISSLKCHEKDKLLWRLHNDTTRLPSILTRLADTLHDPAPAQRPALQVKNVLLTEYPDPGNDDEGKTCSSILGDYSAPLLHISAAETEFLRNNLIIPLNGMLADAVRLNNWRNWHYVGGISSDFSRHGYCARDNWLNRMSEAFLTGGPGYTGIIHPNLKGNEAVKRRLLATLRSRLDLGQLQLTPQVIDFGEQPFNTASPSRRVTVKNTGVKAVQLGSLDFLRGTHFIVQLNTCPATLDAGKSCTIDLLFAPAVQEQDYMDLMTVKSDLVGGFHWVELRGRIPLPRPVFNPRGPVEFPAQHLQKPGEPHLFVLSNEGTAPMELAELGAYSTDIGADFIIAGHDCPAAPDMLEPDEHCSLEVVFFPYSAGRYSGRLYARASFPRKLVEVVLEGTGGEPLLELSETQLSFPLLRFGNAPLVQSVKLVNSGVVPAHVHGLHVQGTDSFSVQDDCPRSPQPLAPGAACSLEVRFEPVRGGTQEGALQVLSDATNGPHWVSFKGQAPSLRPDPLSLIDFGSQPVGARSMPTRVRFTNDTGVPVQVLGLSLQGRQASDFFIPRGGCTGALLLPEHSCVAEVTFRPQALGQRGARFLVEHDGLGSPQSLSLVGEGVSPPPVLLDPTGLSFGEVPVGAKAPAQQLTLRNNSGGPLRVYSVRPSSDEYPLTSDGCSGQVLADGSSCTMAVTFTPHQVAGTRQATLEVETSVGVLTAGLTGESLAGVPTFLPSSPSFPETRVGRASPPVEVLLRNTGNASFTVQSLTLGGDFALVGSWNCKVGQTVAPGGKCSLQLEFRPRSGGTSTGSLVLGSTGAPSSLTLPLTAQGLAEALEVSPGTVDLGGEQVGRPTDVQEILVHNVSRESHAHLTSFQLTGADAADFSIAVNDCLWQSLAPGALCRLKVRMTASSPGGKEAELLITDSNAPLAGPGRDYPVRLVGRAY